MATVSLPLTLQDRDGFIWDLQGNGSIGDGSNDAYDGGLVFNGFSSFTTGETEDNDREVAIGPVTIGDIQLTRKIYVPENQAWARFLEIVTNTGTVATNYTVNLSTNLGSDGSTVVVNTSSGDTTFATDDTWIVTDDTSDGLGNPTTLHVIAGQGGVQPTTVSQNDDNLNYQYNLTLQPGETQIVMHFAAQNQDRATALAKAPQLASLGVAALEGVSGEELAQVINFVSEGLFINDVTVVEGNSGTTDAIFTVSLLESNAETVTVDYETVDGTATAGQDYIATNGTLTFNPGETTKTFTVKISGDNTGELDEAFSVNLTNANNANIVKAEGIGTIATDEPFLFNLGEESFVAQADIVTFSEFTLGTENPSRVFENIPDLGTVEISFGTNFVGQVRTGNSVVTLSDSDPDGPLEFDTSSPAVFTTNDGASDTSPVLSGSPTFNGPISILFSQPVGAVGLRGGFFDAVGSTTIEAYDSDGNSLGSIVNSTTGFEFFGLATTTGENVISGVSFFITGNEVSGFEIDDVTFGTIDVVNSISIIADNSFQLEGDNDTPFTFIVTRTGDITGISTVDYSVVSSENNPADINDFGNAFPSGTVTFNPGEFSKIITVDVVGDSRVEFDESFSVTLSNSSSDKVIRIATATGTIVNDDEIQLTNSNVDENSVNGTLIGTLSATDIGDTDSFTFSLVGNANNRFTVVGNELQVADGTLLNFEANQSHEITVRATDSQGNNFDRAFTITLNDVNEAPTDIQLSNSSIDENSANGTVVGIVGAIDPDAEDTTTLGLLDDADGRFQLVGNELQVADGGRLDFEANTSHQVTVQAVDSSNLSFQETLTINVNDLLEDVPDLVVSNISAPLETFSGQAIEVIWTITNQGNGDATGTWTDRVLLSSDGSIGGDQLLNSFEFVGTIAEGASIERRQAVTLPVDVSGDQFIVVQTDAFGQLAEISNGNNTAIADQAIAVTRLPFPNLQVTEVIAPATTFSEQEAVVEWVVTNTGDGPTSTPFWRDRVWLSLDQTLDATDINLGEATNPSFLAAGDSYRNSLAVALPLGIQGDYFFLVQTDANNQVDESTDEGDNLNAGGPTDVELTPPPDLQVTNVSAPAQGFSGQPFTLSWTVTNEGTGATSASNWFDQIFLSADDILDDGDIFLGQVGRNGALAVDESYSVTQTVSLPIGVSGDFFFIVNTDAGDQVFEFVFDGNNTGFDATPTQINLTPPPDLEVLNVDVPATARAGESLTLNYTLANNGATITPNSFWSEQFYLSVDNQLDPDNDLLLTTRTHNGALDAGESVDKSISFTLDNDLAGDFFAFVVTDSGDGVFELDNDNNTNLDGTAVTIASEPADLVVAAVSTEGVPEAGETLFVNWTVENQGTGDTIATTWTDRVFLSTGSGDTILLDSFVRTGLLNPGVTYSRREQVAIPFTVAGNVELFVETDVTDVVFEATAENNNTSATVALAVARDVPDLQVMAVDYTIADPKVGESLTVNWTVENLGANQTNANFWYDSVYLSTDATLGDTNDIFLGRVRRSNALAVGASYEATGEFVLPFTAIGEFFVLVRTDSSNAVLEDPFEDNNQGIAAAPVTIAANPTPDPNVNLTPAVDPDPLVEPDPNAPTIEPPPELFPDLAVTTVDALTTEAVSGQLLDVSWTVQNLSNDAGDRSWFDTVYLSRDQVFDRATDRSLGSRLRQGLAADASYTETATFTIPQGLSGPFYVFVATDSNNRITEPDGELNNANYDLTPVEVVLPPDPDLIDLVAGTITVPANGVPGQEATITYTVNNEGAEGAIGSWFDSVYLSADDQWDISDPLFGQVRHDGGVVAGGSYSETVTAPLPGVLPGDYFVIVRSDIRNQIPENSEENNIGASLDQVALDAELLALGVPATGTLAEDQSVYYRIEVDAGETLLVNLDSVSETAGNELYLSYEAVPSRTEFDFGFSEAFSPDQQIVVGNTQAGTYYLLAFGDETADFNVSADVLEFSLLEIGTSTGSNRGNVTLVLEGAKFTPNTGATLIAEDGTVLTTSNVIWKDSTELWATFDLQGTETGLYDVQVTDEAESAVLADSFTITNGAVGVLDLQLQGPSAIRPGQPGVLTVIYTNMGQTDVVAPLLQVQADNGQLRLANQIEFTDGALEVLGINFDGPAGILPPGSNGSFSFIFQPISNGPITFSAIAVDEQLENQLDDLRDELQPTYLTREAWNVIWDNFSDSAGQTVGDFQEALAENATYLSQFGEYISDTSRLIGFELQQASDYESLAQQYHEGAFGIGGAFVGDLRATTDELGNVTIETFGTKRSFEREPDGTFRSEVGQTATLVQVGDSYELREPDGRVLTFRADGHLNFVEDNRGNQITTTYTGDRLTQISSSTGESLTYTYNSQGRITTVTDQTGNSITYTYDPTGELLLNITAPGESVTYTYNSDLAITSMTDGTGVQAFFEYDDQGRLIRQSFANEAETLTYDYDSTGGISITDAKGAITQLFLHDSGQLSRVIDPLGRVTQFVYDEAGNPIEIIESNNSTTTITYDELGNVVNQVNPLGQQIQFTYNEEINQIASFTDARGNSVEYNYDIIGNLIGITYADGSVESFTLDEQGNITQALNRRNQAITYTYDERFQLLRQDNFDGSFLDYTYDLQGNILSASNENGTITMVYDDAGNLTKITYPNTRFLEYEYDAEGRRTRMEDQDGNAINYFYDSVGRLARLTDEADALIVSYTYDLVGRLSREDKGNGTYTTYDYDNADQLVSLVHYAVDDSVNSRFDYTYDVLGQQISVSTLEGEWSYTYDTIGQLTRSIFSSNSPDLPNQDLSYIYDDAGNRIRTIDNGLEVEYTSNDLNQYTNVDTTTYDYDLDGNLISKTTGDQTWTYSYDTENFLVSVVEPSGTETQYEYDALGNRTATIIDGIRTEYLIDPFSLGDVVAEYDNNGNLIAQYSYGVGLESRTSDNGEAHYYDFNSIGSAVGLTGITGNYVNRYHYLPFGSNILETESIPNPFEYVGQWGVIEESNGLSFMRARFYDSLTGQFTSADPLGLASGDTNFYRYAVNDPINHNDPSGEILPVLIAIGIGAAVGAGTDAAIQGVAIAVGVQDEFDWTSVGVSAALGGVGGGAGAAFKNLQRVGKYSKYFRRTSPARAKTLAQRIEVGLVNSGRFNDLNRGKVFSHWLPDRWKQWFPDLFNPNHPLGRLNGQFVSPKFHYWTDYYANLPGLSKAAFIGQELLERSGVNLLARVPLWFANSVAAPFITRLIRAIDPNDIIGPEGFGDERWVSIDDTLPYTIRFENVDTATAPAQTVTITHPLDPDLDFRTFRLGSFGFGDFIFEVPENRSFFQQRLDFTEEEGIFVDVFATIDITTGTASWTLTTIDPETGEAPEDPLAGFLPPNLTPPEGDGFVTYTIRPRQDAQTGDVIDAAATIVFDTEAPIDTPPIFNTIDADLPAGFVAPLPETSETEEFTVSWAGEDDPTGSAVTTFTVLVSENGGEFTPFLEDTTLTEATFTGSPGSTYEFITVATDNAGNTQPLPAEPQATITIAAETSENNPPTVTTEIADQVATESSLFTFAVPDNSFTDIDPDDILSLTATLANSDPLPGWLSFDPGTNTFSGTPAIGDIGTLQVQVTATDSANTSVSDTFELSVVSASDTPPTVTAPIADQSTDEDAPFNLDISNNFNDTEGNLTFTATGLPDSLSLDPNTGIISGTPVNDDVGDTAITITATDTVQQSISDVFNLTITNVNDPPTVANPISDPDAAIVDTAFTFLLPANTFTDVDSGDTFSLSATLADGNPLPNWLTFDPATETFSGTPTAGDAGTLQIQVTATDSANASISNTFSLAVNTTTEDTPPTLVTPIADQTIPEDSLFTLDISSNFSDAEGDLTFAATGLPDSLAIDLSTGILSGTPTNDDLGVATVTVTATDTANQAISDTFDLTIENVNDAPTLEDIEKTALEDEVIPFETADFTNAFEDEDEDNLQSIEIVALLLGTLRLNGTEISANDVIPFSELENLEYTPLSDATGQQTAFQITASDGVTDSSVADVIVNLIPVNDAPSFALIDNPDQINQEGEEITLENFATNISTGSNNEAEQLLTFTVTVEGDDIFSQQPELSPVGTLTYALAVGVFGQATVRATLLDNGGTTNEGVDTSIEQTFTITAIRPNNPVNIIFETNSAGLISNTFAYDFTPAGADTQVTTRLTNDVLNLGVEAVFDNLVGLYEIVDINGGIDTNGDSVADLFPTDQAAYAEYAITNRVNAFSIRSGSSGDPNRNTTIEQFGDVILTGGRLYAPFVIANGGAAGFDGFINAENSESDGIFNDAADFTDDLVGYFAFSAANPDGVEHLRSLGSNIFGFEDLPNNLGISDNDFDDAIFQFNFATVI